jgi:hypothetical protein
VEIGENETKRYYFDILFGKKNPQQQQQQTETTVVGHVQSRTTTGYTH